MGLMLGLGAEFRFGEGPGANVPRSTSEQHMTLACGGWVEC